MIFRIKKSVLQEFFKSVGRSHLVRQQKQIIRNGKVVNTFVYVNPDKKKLAVSITRKKLSDKYLTEMMKNTKNYYLKDALEFLLSYPEDKRKETIKDILKFYIKKDRDATFVCSLKKLKIVDIKDSYKKAHLDLLESKIDKLGEKIFEIKKYLDEQGIKYKAKSSEDGYAGNSYYITPLDENGNSYWIDSGTKLVFRISDHVYTATWRRDESMVSSVKHVKELIDKAKEYKKIDEEESKKQSEEDKKRKLENKKRWEELKKQYPDRDWYFEDGGFTFYFTDKMKQKLKDCIALLIPNGKYGPSGYSLLYGVKKGTEKRRNNSYLIPEEKLEDKTIINAVVEYI